MQTTRRWKTSLAYSYYGKVLIPFEELKEKIERYIDYYNNERIKQKLAGMSPVKYRTLASQLAA